MRDIAAENNYISHSVKVSTTKYCIVTTCRSKAAGYDLTRRLCVKRPCQLDRRRNGGFRTSSFFSNYRDTCYSEQNPRTHRHVFFLFSLAFVYIYISCMYVRYLLFRSAVSWFFSTFPPKTRLFPRKRNLRKSQLDRTRLTDFSRVAGYQTSDELLNYKTSRSTVATGN